MSQDTPFRFPSARQLKTNLGKIDATVECTELAIREFISNSLSKESPSDYIKDLSRRHGVKVDDVDINFLKVRLSQLYIIAVYEQAEGFLESFRDEHPYSSNWKYEEGDDLLKRVLKNINANFQQVKQDIGMLEVDLFDYYRLVRNRFVHSEIDESKNDSKVPQLRSAVAEHESYGRLNAPNIYHEITFDDFVLFTRVLKHIAKLLCILSRPSDEVITDMASSLIKSGKSKLQLQKLYRLKNNPNRAKNALESFLCEMYGLKREEAEPIVHSLHQDLLA